MEQKINSENLSAENQTDGAPVLSPEAMRNLAKMKKYMNILFILCCIAAGLIIIGVIVVVIDRLRDGDMIRMYSRISLVFGICGAFAIFCLGSWLGDAARACKKFGENPQDVRHLEAAIRYQSGYWKWKIILSAVFIFMPLVLFMLG
ncbi:MAG: hypothetical protein LBP85_01360 [Prevotellaceae bacterium]|jgi:hypothetical protein|nr:hypothetical protein [Prevotellaceae bacterium]